MVFSLCRVCLPIFQLSSKNRICSMVNYRTRLMERLMNKINGRLMKH
nr:MAG TPA: hypothetical protein [Caudoviricetes sp.]